MSAIICGSFAYDHIMNFEDEFANHILPDKLHRLNLSFLVPSLRREFGGCAGNIAFNLKKIGGNPIAVGTVGNDFKSYEDWLKSHDIEASHLKIIADAYTAQAFITTDSTDNQITAFHPGAMNYSASNSVTGLKASIGIISPDSKDGMTTHASELFASKIPFIFDPGQGLPMFDGSELCELIEMANWVTVNEYEAAMLEKKTGLTSLEISNKVDAYIVTLGEKGSKIMVKSETLHVGIVEPMKIADPTGCGDAYRAGLLYGFSNSLELDSTVKLASLLGAIKVESSGTQNHLLSREIVEEKYRTAFNENIRW